MKKQYYAIRVGFRSNLIVRSWAECSALVTGCKGAKFKGFVTEAEAKQYLLDCPDQVTKVKRRPVSQEPEQITLSCVRSRDGSPYTQEDGTVFIPAAKKLNKFGYYKPRYYEKDGVLHAHFGTTIGCKYNGAEQLDTPPWETANA